MKMWALLLIAIIGFLSRPAFAQIGNASCTTEGEIARIPTSPSVNLICNDGAWVLMKQLNANGNVRVLHSGPQSSSSSKINAEDCSGQCSKGGELCYASDRMRLCDGSKWVVLSPSIAPTVGCPQSGVFNGAQSQILNVAAGCAVTFRAWGGGGGGGTGGNAGSVGNYETVSIASSGKVRTYFLSVGGGGGSGNYMAAGVGGSGVAGFSGENGSWHIIAGGSGGGGAASAVWTDGLGTGKPVLVAAGGKGSASDAETCTAAKAAPGVAKCGYAQSGGDQNNPAHSGLLAKSESPGSADDDDRPSGAGEGGSGVSRPENNASAGNDGAIRWATCEAAPCD